MNRNSQEVSANAQDWDALQVVQYKDAVKDGLAPLYLTTIALHGTEFIIVKLADDSLAKIEKHGMNAGLVEGIPEHTPEYLRAWIDKCEGKNGWPKRAMDFKRRLLDDRRMSEFWDWLGEANFTRYPWAKSSLTVADNIWRSTRLPGKPGNMTPTQREAYFKKVRKHASALAELLEGTRFDQRSVVEVSDAELDKTVDEALSHWGDDESDEGHVVAFLVNAEGKYKFNYNYPESALQDTLSSVLEWTAWDDQWDGGIFSSSAPIVQANAESTQVIYFTCMLHGWFRWHGVEIPFPILATVANVALELCPDKQTDEDTVRKQIKRYHVRQAKLQAERPNAFDDAGQNSKDWDDSVLFDPF